MSELNLPGKVIGSQRRIYMGLGEAVLRLIHVEILYTTNSGVESELVTERNLIVQALNQQYQLDLGFDCNADSVPDTVEIFQQSAKTACCRILPMDGSELETSRKGGFDSSRRVEHLPDMTKVNNALADLGVITPEQPAQTASAPQAGSPKVPKGFLAKTLGQAFGKPKNTEEKKERGVRREKSKKE